MKNIYLKGLLLLLLCEISPARTTAQIYYIDYMGTSACPTPGNVPSVAANASGSIVNRSTMTCMAAANVFNSSTLNNTATINDNSYIEFSVTPDVGYQLNVTSLSFFIQGSITSPNQLEVRYSTDGFATSTSWGAAPNTTTSPGATNVWDFNDFSTTSGETVTFRFYPYGTQRSDLGTTSASASGTIRLDRITLNGTVINPMPVKLVSFGGSYEQNAIILNWETAWEEQNEGFEIEQSTDALIFKNVGFIKGNATTKTSSKYEFSYYEPIPGKINYFRLKQIDVGGHFEYSRIISLKSMHSIQNEYYVYPNPNNGNFILSSPKTTSGDIRLYDKSGKDIDLQFFKTYDDDTFEIKAKNAPQPGLYHLRIKGTETSVKVLIE